MLPRKTPSAASPSPISSGWWWLRGRRGPLRVLTRFGTFGRSRVLRFFRATERSSPRPGRLLPALAGAVRRRSAACPSFRRVGGENRAGRRHLAVDEPKRPGHAVVAKEALAAAQKERVDHQPELVDQV